MGILGPHCSDYPDLWHFGFWGAGSVGCCLGIEVSDISLDDLGL